MWIWVVLAVAIGVVIVAAIIALEVMRQRKERGDRLRREFGPEYDLAVDEYGSERRAQSALVGRRKRVEKLRLRPIPQEERERLADAWTRNQAQFVDEPEAAFDEAARLVDQAMEARGYPVRGDFDERYADLSVEHGYVLGNYRDGRAVAVAREAGEDVGTDEYRRAMVCYRALFNELLTSGAAPPELERRRMAS